MRPPFNPRVHVRILRLISAVVAATAVVATFSAAVFRSPDGSLSGRFVVPLAVAAAFAVVAAFGTAARLRALAWSTLAVVGYAVFLQLVRAGPLIGYQHLSPWPRLLDGANAVWTGFFVAHLLIVLLAVRPLLARFRGWFGAHLPSWRGPAVVAVFVMTSATLSREVSQYAGELVLAAVGQIVALCTAVLAVRALPGSDAAALTRRLDSWLGPSDESGHTATRRIGRFVLLAVVWTVVATAALNVLAYQRHPHVPDDVVYLLHARYFARGMLTMPLPPVPEAFDLDLMTVEATRWYSPVPPGWPAVLAVGTLLGAPWLVNPVLSGLAVLLAYLFLHDLYGMRTARIGTLLLCVSPWFLFMGMSFMTHQLTLVAALVAAVCTARLRRNGTIAWAVPVGIGLGVVALGRPLEGFTVAAMLAIWTLGRKPLARAGAVAVMAAASIVTASIVLPYNRHLTGSATTFPIMAYTDAHYGPGTNALGFGANRGLGWTGLDPWPGHGWRDVLVNADLNAFQVNIELFGWATGSLLLIALLALSRRMRRPDAWMLVAVAAIVGMHSLYWFSGGPDFGARYWYLILVPCVALAASGIEVLSDWFGDRTDRQRVPLAVVLLCLAALLVFVPWRAADKYHGYRGMRPDIRQLARENTFGRSIVLVRGNRHPDYASAAAYNPVDLQADVPIYAWDRSTEVRQRVLEAYADRPVWIVEGPTVSGDGYRVVAGPLPAGTPIMEPDRER